mmetsp:Transcript_15954/g.45596  ORF Transcript_15954/g.45596 Transcript_15954/m.45596 type:complete len:367 (-) Transcript_15954:1171-2271(-)
MEFLLQLPLQQQADLLRLLPHLPKLEHTDVLQRVNLFLRSRLDLLQGSNTVHSRKQGGLNLLITGGEFLLEAVRALRAGVVLSTHVAVCGRLCLLRQRLLWSLFRCRTPHQQQLRRWRRELQRRRRRQRLRRRRRRRQQHLDRRHNVLLHSPHTAAATAHLLADPPQLLVRAGQAALLRGALQEPVEQPQAHAPRGSQAPGAAQAAEGLPPLLLAALEATEASEAPHLQDVQLSISVRVQGLEDRRHQLRAPLRRRLGLLVVRGALALRVLEELSHHPAKRRLVSVHLLEELPINSKRGAGAILVAEAGIDSGPCFLLGIEAKCHCKAEKLLLVKPAIAIFVAQEEGLLEEGHVLLAVLRALGGSA